MRQIIGQHGRQLRLAGAVVRQAQQRHHQLAGRSLGQLLAQELERSAIGLPGEELVAVDQAEQRHGLAPQRMDDVVVVDDMAMLAVGTTAAALQRHQQGRAQQQLQPVVIEPNAHPMPDQPGGHGVEDLAQREAARRGDADEGLLVVAGARRRRWTSCRIPAQADQRSIVSDNKLTGTD